MEQKIKLNITDYVFGIDNIDLFNCFVTYSFDEIEIKTYKNGEFILNKRPVIILKLEGKDKAGDVGEISLTLDISLEELNNFPVIPTDISRYVIEGEAFIKYPLENNTSILEFDFGDNSHNDIFKKLSSVWVAKEKENIFVFKVSTNEVFTYFKIKFKDL